MTNTPAEPVSGAPAPGRLVDGAESLDDVVAGCADAGVTVIGLHAGPGEVLGIHLGARVRDEYRRRLADAGLRVITVVAPEDLLAERPDEGAAADIADYLDLAADVGAESLTLTLTPAQTRPRDAAAEDTIRSLEQLRGLAARAARLDVAAVLRNTPAVPTAGAVIDLIDTLHVRLRAAEGGATGSAPNDAGMTGAGMTGAVMNDAAVNDAAVKDGAPNDAGVNDAVPNDAVPDDGGQGGVGHAADAVVVTEADPTGSHAHGGKHAVVIGMAWDPAVSAAAGESPVEGWGRVQGLLLHGHGHVVVPDAGTAERLHRSIPDSAPVPVLLADPAAVPSAGRPATVPATANGTANGTENGTTGRTKA